MVNPFDDESNNFHVLINSEEQYSLWPTSIPVPAGWSIVFEDKTRAECLEYVEKNWVDMRPKSLRESMKSGKE